jgi:hypothetical protein
MLRLLALAVAALAVSAIAHAAPITVTYSEDFAEMLVDDYGEREGAVLSDEIIDDLDRELARAGIEVARIAVVIEDAKPNRPTMEQVRNRPGLDMFRSISLGGMELTGTAFDSEGAVVGELTYDWYENNIDQVIGSATWGDARRASNRFARRFVDQLAGQ